MRVHPSFANLAFILTLASVPFLSGCAALQRWNTHRSDSHVFITPLRCEAERGHLRLAVKDNIDIAGTVTTAGSHFLALTRSPAKEDAPCLDIARERGVQIIGKTNLSEFAVSPSGVNEFYGTPRNPFCFWRNRIPGGSSSGSAVAVAGGYADVAFGTDTAGSIRVPAACCGVVGLKTTHGLVPIKGVFPIEPDHLDTVGPLGKDIPSTAVGMDLLERGFLTKYAAAKAAQPTAASIRVGRLRIPGTDPKIDAAIDKALAKAGFQVIPLDGTPVAQKWEQAKKDGNAVAASGAWMSDKLYQYIPGVGARTRVVILTGQLNYLTNYKPAIARIPQWRAALNEAFRRVDVIALPTLQRTPFFVPLKLLDIGLLEAQMLQLQNTVPVNYAGVPALALPVPLKGSDFAVTSLQLIGPNNSEAKLLNAGRFVEQATFPHHHGAPSERLTGACSGHAEALQ